MIAPFLYGVQAQFINTLSFFCRIKYPIPWRKTFLEHFIVKPSTLLECCAVTTGKRLPLLTPSLSLK